MESVIASRLRGHGVKTAAQRRRKFLCKPCRRSFATARDLVDHWAAGHKGQLQCLYCLNPVPGSRTKLTVLPRVRRVQIDLGTGEEMLSLSLFCGDGCFAAYQRQAEASKVVGNPDTAPYSTYYTDQMDWNR